MDNNVGADTKMASLSDMAAVQPMTTTTTTTTATTATTTPQTQPSSTFSRDSLDSPRATTKPAITMQQQDILSKLDLAPATLEALKTLSAISSDNSSIGTPFSNCDKLTASLEQLRAKKNINLFEKLDKIKQEFSGINHKVTQLETSIMDMRKDTNNLVKSLPSDNSKEADDGAQYLSSKGASSNSSSKQPLAASRAGK